MRRLGLLLLFACPARAGDEARELERFIDANRCEASRRDYVVRVGRAELPKGARLEVAYRVGHYFRTYVNMTFWRSGDEIGVLRMTLGASLGGFGRFADMHRFAPGCKVEQATIPVDAYRSLMKKLVLVETTRLERRPGVGDLSEGEGAGPTSADGRLYLLVAGNVRTALLADTLLPIFAIEKVAHHQLDRSGRATLRFALLMQAAGKWRFSPVSDTKPAVDRLLTDLTGQPPLSEWRAWHHWLLLGSLADKGKLPALEKLAKQDADLHDVAQRAIRQVRARTAEDPVAALGALLNDPNPRMREWAHTLMRTRHAKAYRAALLALFGSASASDRLLALNSLRSIDRKDRSLARKGLGDKSAAVRMEAVLQVWSNGPDGRIPAQRASCSHRSCSTNRRTFRSAGKRQKPWAISGDPGPWRRCSRPSPPRFRRPGPTSPSCPPGATRKVGVVTTSGTTSAGTPWKD